MSDPLIHLGHGRGVFMEAKPEDREPLRVLLLEDVPTDAELALRELHKLGIQFVSKRVDTRHEYERALSEFRPNVILSDFSLPGAFDGLTALDIARRALPDIPYIFVSGTIGEDRAVEAMKRGATDYVLKDRLSRLVPVVARALDERREREARRRAEEEISRQRAFLRQVIDIDPNFIFAKDREGRFALVNVALAQAYGCSVDELLGKTDADFNPNREEVEHFRRDDIEVMDTLKEKFIPEERITDASGNVHWLQTIKRPIVGPEGRADMMLGVATDITERKRNEEALRESEYRLDLALKASDLATWDWNVATGEVRFSGHWWPILGYEPGDIPLRIEAWERLTHPDDLARVKSALATHLKGSAPVLDVEYRMRAKSGEWRWIRTVGRVVERDAAGRAMRQTGTHGDITKRKLQELRIVRYSRVLAVLSGINSTIVRVKDRDRLFREACRIAVEHGGFRMAWIGLVVPDAQKVQPVAWAGAELGYLEELGASIKKVSMDEGVAGQALRDKRAVLVNNLENDPRVLYKTAALARGYRSLAALPLVVSDRVVGVFVLYAAETEVFDEDETRLLDEIAGDISFALDHIAKSERLDYLAYYDGVTGIANSKLFHERVGQLIHSIAPEEQGFAVAVLDLERFRNINETLGMAAGDAVLKQLAERLSRAVGEPGTVARISADRFAAVLSATRSETELAHVLEQRILAALNAPFSVSGEELRIPAKVGVAMYPSDGHDAAVLFVNAEAALTKAKQSGERYLFYAPEMNARVAGQLRLENELRAALQDEFVLYYQPRVDLASGKISGLEALIRWQHRRRGLVSPAEFIPVLEQTGMILEAGRWAIKRAALDCAGWVADGLNPPRIAVNVSQAQLRRKEFVQDVKVTLAAAGEYRDRIDIEITESMLMENIEGNIEKLGELRAMGIHVALDDFGTGYSSLSWLARLPIDSLKIDRSFVTQMAKSPEQMAIVSTVISLARALNLTVVAEGVETEEQVNLLRLLRCDEAQGYRFHRPLPPEKITALLR